MIEAFKIAIILILLVAEINRIKCQMKPPFMAESNILLTNIDRCQPATWHYRFVEASALCLQL